MVSPDTQDQDLIDVCSMKTPLSLERATGEHFPGPDPSAARRAFVPVLALSEWAVIVLACTGAGMAYDLLVDGDLTIDVVHLIIGCGTVAGLYTLFAYTRRRTAPRSASQGAQDRGALVLYWTASAVFFVATALAVKAEAAIRVEEILLFYVSGLGAILGFNAFGGRILRRTAPGGRAAGRRLVVLDATGPSGAADIGPLLEAGCRVLARFAVPDDADPRRGLPRALGDLVAFCRTSEVDDVVVAVPWSEPQTLEDALAALRILPLPVLLLPDRTAREVLHRPAVRCGTLRLPELQREPLTPTDRVLKRSLDVVLSGAALVLLLPLLVLIAVLVRLDSPGPVFFRQTRGGFAGRPFGMYKFRSMRTLDDGSTVRQASRDDERITRVGRVLRRTSLDELPQLVNVLKGDMSIVGPRPHALAHDDMYRTLIPSYALRHHVKPGITGWAQANGFRGATPTMELMKSRIDHDLWYVANWSLWLDIRTILLTAATLLRCERAF